MKTKSLNIQNHGSRSFRLLGTLAFFFILLLAVKSAFTQSQGQRQGWGNATPEERAKRQTEMMKTQLTLTPAQEPKVAAINLKYARKMEDVRKIQDTAVQHKTAKGIQSQKDNELKGVFTAAQFKQYLKLMEEMKNRRRDAPPSNQH
jgi:hypothetical protein